MNLPFNINEREKKFLIIGAIAVILVIFYNLISWYGDVKGSVKEASDMKWFMLNKQLNKLSQKNVIEKRAETIVKELAIQEKAFLSGNKTPVAAAELQKFLKDSASSLKIDVKLERTLSPVESEFYLGIPVEIGFTASTGKLKDLLYRINKSPLLLTISEMKIKVTNIRNPVDTYTTLIVTGFIKKPETKEQDEKKAKNAA
jgi:Tfp pilus assembly protein PilO